MNTNQAATKHESENVGSQINKLCKLARGVKAKRAKKNMRKTSVGCFALTLEQ
jgi:hypothetical protein